MPTRMKTGSCDLSRSGGEDDDVNVNVQSRGRIQTEHTVASATVGNESNGIQLVHEVLECGVDNVVKLRFQQSLHDPETVPVVLFPEPSTLTRSDNLPN